MNAAIGALGFAVLFVAVASELLACTSGRGTVWLEGARDGATAANASQQRMRNGRYLADDEWRGNAAPAAAPRAGATGSAPAPPHGDGSTPETEGPSNSVGYSFVTPDRDDLFRNTYYDFPRELRSVTEVLVRTLYDASCKPIANVAQRFHDDICVQGSGRLSSGETVSYARRECSCAAVCPRSGQQICFEKLDPARFPNGRGAMGRPITPLRTVAVDDAVIPLGTVVFIPEFVGLPGQGGAPHDGCFTAEDRGVKVVGRQVDVFTGDPTVTAQWNQLVPSNRGVHVRMNDARCSNWVR